MISIIKINYPFLSSIYTGKYPLIIKGNF